MTLLRRVSFLMSMVGVLGCGSSITPCEKGASACACAEGAVCDDGLACDEVSRTCLPPRIALLPAIDARARSCELLLEDTSAHIANVRFDDTLRGEQVREAPRTALAFHALSDIPIDAASVELELLGEGTFRIARAQCFDQDGQAIASGGLASDG